MITARLSVSDGPITCEISVRAASLARARHIAGEGSPGVSVSLTDPVFPVSPRVTVIPESAIPARAA